MPAIHLRPATAADQPHLVAFIRTLRLNPFNLHWPNFVVAVDEAAGQIVGTAQVKAHRDGSRELASIGVASAYRRQGLATRLVQQVLAQETGPLYLTCRNKLGPFYARFGFEPVTEPARLPPYFRRLVRLVGWLTWLVGRKNQLLVMYRPGS